MRPLLLAALFVPTTAFAEEVPAFSADDRVVLVPADLDLRTTAVAEAVGQVERDVYVVVFEQANDGRIGLGRESHTEDVIEDTWAAWSKDPAFDPQEDVLIVLGMDEREVRLRYGSRWDTELGLARDGVLWVIDAHFLPKAKAGDLDGALADLVRGADAAIPQLQDEKKRRQEREAREAEEQATREREAAEAAEARERQLRTYGPFAVLLGLLGVGGAGATVMRRPVRYARLAFEAELDEWREKLARADAAFAELRIGTEIRDQVVELRLKGARTKALLQKITALLDEIQVGIEGLRRHVDRVAARVKGRHPFDAASWLAGIDAFSEPFSIDTGEVTGRLFDEPTRRIEVDPNAFVATLEERWAEARKGWQRLLDAVQASLRAARDDLSTDDLQAMEGQLAAAGISALWVARHPLKSDPDRVWQQLDALRKADPVGYLDELEALLAAEDAIGDAVVAVIEDATAAREARSAAEAVRIDDLDTTVRDPDRHPDAVVPRAQALHAELDDLLGRGGDPGRVDAKAAEVVAAWNDVERRRTALRQAVDGAAGRVAEARERQARLASSFTDNHARIERMLGDHVRSNLDKAWTEHAEGQADLEEGAAATAEAEAALAAGDHLAAWDAAGRAIDEHGQAAEDLEQLVAVLDGLDQAKKTAETLVDRLVDQRAAIEQELRSIGVAHAAGRLDAGDLLLAELRTRRTEGPVDWHALSSAGYDVLAAWKEGLRKAREAEARAWDDIMASVRGQQRPGWASSSPSRSSSSSSRSSYSTFSGFSSSRSSSSSSWSSSSSSFGSSRSSSWSSSSRSGGSSFSSSSSRSGGRSFSSGGGRSGGRKF